MSDNVSEETAQDGKEVSEPTSVFLRACRGLPTSYTPIWFMRQAGRYMEEYRAIRAKYSMLDVINTPELAAEVTLQPIDRFGFDAAIIFADILPPLIGMGLQLEFVKGEGPTIHNPLTRTHDIDMLATPPAEETMQPTLQAIRSVSAELETRGIPLIGFAGAPFTLASYAIEGSGSKSYVKTKALMYSEPAAWKRLMTKLVTVQGDYLARQVDAGAAAIQVFDSWAGLALGQDDYRQYVLPYNRSLFERLARTGAPTINFSTGTGAYIRDVASAGGDVIGVDWRMPLEWYRQQIGVDRATHALRDREMHALRDAEGGGFRPRPVQGNLDPVSLLAPWRELKSRVDAVLEGAGSMAGHIFNLGHGIFPNTPVDSVQRVVDYVHEKSAA